MTLPFNIPGGDTVVDPTIWSILLGVGLSAAAGFRVFVPMLMLSAASVYFGLPLPKAMHMLGTETAFMVLLAATLIEVGAYYVPWLDNFLDSIATPISIVAGTAMTGLFMPTEVDPTVKWTIALIAGGGTAGLVQSTTNISRLTSSLATFGLANPIIATVEFVASVILSIFAVFLPVVAAIVLVGVLGVVVWLLLLFKRRKSGAIQPESPVS